MNAMVEEQKPEKRLHCPAKVLGDNFYPMMYGQYRVQRITAMSHARRSSDTDRARWVREARDANRVGIRFLRMMALR